MFIYLNLFRHIFKKLPGLYLILSFTLHAFFFIEDAVFKLERPHDDEKFKYLFIHTFLRFNSFSNLFSKILLYFPFLFYSFPFGLSKTIQSKKIQYSFKIVCYSLQFLYSNILVFLCYHLS